jgi:hypothetical protein
MVAAIADAVIGPMPGMLASRLLTAFGSTLSHDYPLDRFDAHLKRLQFCNEASQCLACQCRHVSVTSILQQIDEIDDAVPPRRCNDAEFGKVAAQCID